MSTLINNADKRSKPVIAIPSMDNAFNDNGRYSSASSVICVNPQSSSVIPGYKGPTNVSACEQSGRQSGDALSGSW